MKKIYLVITAIMLTMTVAAQTLSVKTGSVTYLFPSTQTGDMTYNEGETLTVMGKTFTMSDINEMAVVETAVTNNTVSIDYDGTTASVVVAGNVAQYVSTTVEGAHVTIIQSNTADVDGDEITYVLSGTTTDGEFALGGSYKCTISLNGLTLTNPSGAALNIANGKRIQISAKNSTVNTLTDGANGSQTGCIYSKGQIQFQGKGTLNVAGNTKHAIKSGDYISVKNLTLNITKAVADGINCNEYFLMESGNVSISGVGDDGIQCDLDGDTATEASDDEHTDEDTGSIYIDGGSLTITTTAAASKGVKAEGNVVITDGTLNITTKGAGTYDSDEQDAKGCACLKSDGDMTISGGTLTLASTGSGGKCIKADNLLTVSGGTISAKASGSNYSYGSYSASAKAIKAGTRTESSSVRAYAGPGGGGGGFPGGGGGGGGFPGGGGGNKSYDYSGGIVVNGGTIIAIASNHEAIESKSTIEITNGYVYAESSDDAINSASTFTISGGYVMGNSSGNDGLDANGNFEIKGGNVFAVATTSPEVGLDANTEGGYKLTITGGNVVSIGGLESGSSLSGVTSKSASYSKGSWYAFQSGGSTKFYFKVPSNSRMASGMTLVSSSTPSVSTASSVTSNIWNGYGKTN
ncbi:MAG: carbohydrate-binding domain-containing protein [Prevotella sp.]|nr:carbohydrate-binding domain-containing protein [Prevotella sp.]